MYDYRDIGSEVQASVQDLREYTLITGKKVEARSAFFVGSEESNSIRETAQKWGNEISEPMNNKFVSVSFTDKLSNRMNREVFKIIIEHENGSMFLVDAYSWEVLEHLLKGTIENGTIKGEFILTKKQNHNTVSVVPLDVYRNSRIRTKDSIKKVTKTKLKIGTKYFTKTDELIYLGSKGKDAIFLTKGYDYKKLHPEFEIPNPFELLSDNYSDMRTRLILGNETLTITAVRIWKNCWWFKKSPFAIEAPRDKSSKTAKLTFQDPFGLNLNYRSSVSLNVLKEEEEYLTPEECTEILEALEYSPVLSTVATIKDNLLTLNIELKENILTKHLFKNHEQYGVYKNE